MDNTLFIGADKISLEGQFLKHPSLIKNYNFPKSNKLKDTPTDYIGLDLETNHKTAELKLLGIWDTEYRYYMTNFLGVLFNIIKNAYFSKKKLVYWSKLDPFILYKQFLLVLPPEEQQKSLNKWGKIFGNYDNKTGEWTKDNPPVVAVEIGNYEFGISSAIRGSIQFYFIKNTNRDMICKVWAYDIAGLYKSNLTKEGGRFDYYTKGDKELHLIDWERFYIDKEYRTRVLKSNELDARVVRDLALKIDTDFYNLFGIKKYPKSLISTGALARSGIVASTLLDVGETEYKNTIKNIPLVTHLDDFYKQLGDSNFKDFICLINESYSGGDIETFSYGYTPKAYYSDIASAYPAVIVELKDLKDSIVTTGQGVPPHIDNSYCFIRGTVTVPETVYHHPLTVKHPTIKDLNIRPNGTFIAGYTLPERDYLLTLGVTFENEVWYNVETLGHLSPLAKSVRFFLNRRAELIAKGDSAEYIAKIIATSIYGITYEATDTYNYNIDGTINRAGYRGGEFYNPIYASYITAETRIKICKVVNSIKDKGGTPILSMTDSVFWKGSKDMIPKELVTEVKTLGFYEGVSEIKDLYCLGAGRYSYIDKESSYESLKTRGLRIQDLINDKGLIIDFNWLDAIKTAKYRKFKTHVTVLLSVGLINHVKKWKVKDLGLVAEDVREVDLLVGATKRFIPEDMVINELQYKLFETKPLMIPPSDLSHKILRDYIQDRPYEPREVKREKQVINANRTYYKKNKQELKDNALNKYQLAKSRGYDTEDSRKLSKVSDNKFKAVVFKPNFKRNLLKK